MLRTAVRSVVTLGLHCNMKSIVGLLTEHLHQQRCTVLDEGLWR